MIMQIKNLSRLDSARRDEIAQQAQVHRDEVVRMTQEKTRH
jgi:hypothetical protein